MSYFLTNSNTIANTWFVYTKEKERKAHREKKLEKKAKTVRNGYLYDAELGSAVFLF